MYIMILFAMNYAWYNLEVRLRILIYISDDKDFLMVQLFKLVMILVRHFMHT